MSGIQREWRKLIFMLMVFTVDITSCKGRYGVTRFFSHDSFRNALCFPGLGALNNMARNFFVIIFIM